MKIQICPFLGLSYEIRLKKIRRNISLELNELVIFRNVDAVPRDETPFSGRCMFALNNFSFKKYIITK